MIYLIRGEQGKYSDDHVEWIVGAWSAKEAAETEAKRLTNAMKALEVDEDWSPSDHKNEILAVDPKASCWSWPTYYSVIEVSFYA